jgi:MFS transporter, putative metabolite:H+ symporter
VAVVEQSPRLSGDPTAQDISARLDRLPFLPFHLRIAAILGAGTLFDAFDSLSIGAALTMIVATFHLDFRSSGTLISAAFVGQFFGALAFGYVSEFIGRKKAFVIALTIFGLCSLGAALAQSVNDIIIARMIQGIGLGAEVPVAAALFTEFVRGHARGKIVMIYESLFTWGLFLAPVVGLSLYKGLGPEIGWRVLFAIGGVPLVIAAIAAWKLPESPRWLAAKHRLPEADAIVARMEAEARRRGQSLPPPVPTAPVLHEPMRLTDLFRGIYRKRTFVIWTMWFCAYFISNGYQAWQPTLYMKIGGLPTEDALALTIFYTICQLGMAYVVASMIDRHGRRRWFAGGFLFGALAACGGAIASGVFGVRGWETLLIFGLLMGMGTSINSLGVYVYTPELYPTRMRAWGTATGSSLNRLASAIAPSVVGWLLAVYGGIAIVFAMFAVVGLFGATILWFFGEETKRRNLENLSP